MPSTYTLISSNVLTSSAASVTFSAIPATYTDLVLRISGRKDDSSVTSGVFFTVNGSSAANYSLRRLGSNGSTASSSGTTNNTEWYTSTSGNGATSNTYNNAEYYFANYASNANKTASAFEAMENNATTASIQTRAMLRSVTDAITSITLSDATSNWLSGSSFYLYGIKNS